MSHSYRHTPITGITTAESEKRDKQLASRRWRHAVREAIRRGRDVLPVRRECSDPWLFDKDGKRWWGNGAPWYYPDVRPWQVLAK